MAAQRAGPYTAKNMRPSPLREQRETNVPSGCVMRISLRVTMMASLLVAMSIVTDDRAIAGERLESVEQMVPQRPGMKTEEDYQRFEQAHGLPQRPEPTARDMDRLRLESQKELRIEEEYSRRNSSNLSTMSDEEILDAIRLNKGGSIEPPSVDAREDWPKTPEEFEKKYGRPPQRREEVEFYFDTDDDSIDE